jgi:hypothetical protein
MRGTLLAADGSPLPYSIAEERKVMRVFKREAAARYGWPKLSDLVEELRVG